jgi:antitoxin (DNA-binding transcriptional repressor) of toxin-antitoxin stability system
MATVTIHELRNHGDELVDRVVRGERITITRAGRPVVELRALRPALSAEVLLSRWSRLPAVDPVSLRADVDRLQAPACECAGRNSRARHPRHLD